MTAWRTDGPTTSGRCVDLLAQGPAQGRRPRGSAGRVDDLTLGPAEVRADHERRAPVEQLPQRGQRGPDPQVVGDRPPSSGTLKSTRTRTVWPVDDRRGRRASGAAGSQRGGHELGQLDQSVRVAPLVVVPADDLRPGCPWPSWPGSRTCTTPAIRRCPRTRWARREYTSLPASGPDSRRLLEGRIDLLDRRVPLEQAHQVGDRAVRHRHPHGRAVQAPLELAAWPARRPSRPRSRSG